MLGKLTNETAKMIGIIPAWLILIGRYDCSLFPLIPRPAYVIGIRLWASFTNTIIAVRIIVISRIVAKGINLDSSVCAKKSPCPII